jgi:hypothetical protein
VFLKPEFAHLLGNEFAVVTTRYQEKYAIVAVKDGSKLLPHHDEHQHDDQLII